MNIWENAVVTNKGLSMLAKLVKGNTLTITKAVTGSGYVSPVLLQQQTAVSGPKQHMNFRPVSYPEIGKCAMPCYLTNDGLDTGYTAMQVGVYAMDPNEGEILFFICQASSGTGTAVPAEAEMPGYNAEWTLYFQYGQADGVNVTVDPANTVSIAMLDEVRAIAESGVSGQQTGVSVLADNTAGLPFAGMKIYGKSTQETSTGAQLLDASLLDPTYYAEDSGEITARIADTRPWADMPTLMSLPAGDYAMSSDRKVPRIEILNDAGSVVGTALNLKPGEVLRFTLTETTGIKIKFATNATTYPVNVGRVMLNAGTAAKSFEPYTGGAAGPTPEYPIEIHSVGEDGSITVRVLGANLITTLPASKTTDEVTGTNNEDGSYTLIGSTGEGYFVSNTVTIGTLSPGRYSLSGGTANIQVIARFNKPPEEVINTTGVNRFTIKEPTVCQLSLQVIPYVTVNDTIRPMLHIGEELLDFEEAKTPQTMTISTPNGLRGVPVKSGGNYTDANGQEWICDEIDLVRGVHIKRVVQVVCNKPSVHTEDSLSATVPLKGTTSHAMVGVHTKAAICTATDLYYYDRTDNIHFYVENIAAWVFVPADYDYATNPPVVLAAMKTPVETALTDEEIEAYKALCACNPVTTVLNDGGAEVGIDYITAANEAAFRMIFDSFGGAHASTHATGGSDPILPADIGAVNKAGDTMTGTLKLENADLDISRAGGTSKIYTNVASPIAYWKMTSPSGGVIQLAINQETGKVLLGIGANASNITYYELYGAHSKPTPADIGAAPAYTYGTADIEAGSASPYETGHLHLVYE